MAQQVRVWSEYTSLQGCTKSRIKIKGEGKLRQGLEKKKMNKRDQRDVRHLRIQVTYVPDCYLELLERRGNRVFIVSRG